MKSEETMATTTKKQTTSKGKTLGLKIGETLAHVFAENEKRAKKWTDEEISRFLKSEFADRRPKNFDKPNRARRFYNRGGFTKGNVPGITSKRYDKDGKVLSPKKVAVKKTAATKPAKTTPAKKAPKKG